MCLLSLNSFAFFMHNKEPVCVIPAMFICFNTLSWPNCMYLVINLTYLSSVTVSVLYYPVPFTKTVKM